MCKQFRNDWKVIMYYLKIAFHIDRSYIPLLFFAAVDRALIPFVTIVMSKYIIDEMLTAGRRDQLMLLVIVTLTSNGILLLLDQIMTYFTEVKNKKVITGFELHLNERIMNMDFEHVEDPEILDLKEKAIYPVKNQGVLQNLINHLISNVQNLITILSLVVLISTLNIGILVFLLFFVLINILICHKSQNAELQFITEIIKDNREMNYYRELTQDFSMGKDIRLYQMKTLILSKIRDYIERSTDLFQKLMSKTGSWSGVSNIMVQLQMSVIYGYIAYKVVKNEITIGSFTMYITASITFCSALTNILQNLVQLKHILKFLHPYKEFEDFSAEIAAQTGKIPLAGEDFSIEFRNVYFKYPHSRENTLSNICIQINPGEKLSIVGMNGAGKTTFVKLLCRLYQPTKGEIRCNGVDISTFDSRQYQKYISTIFQDFKLFAFSIAENIAMDEHWNEKKINEVLSQLGLFEKVSRLEKSVNTPLYASYDHTGIELSGGESQKLAIARALYKDSKIIILDEPTAALDPIAESEIFNHLNILIKNKTSIYISHRLSSCKFCDHIAVFHEGKIVQYGSHQDLMSEVKGKYYELFMAQAKYYIGKET